MELAIVGNDLFVLGFRLAGVKRTEGVPAEEFPQHLERILADKDVGILIVNAHDLARAPPSIKRRATESIDPVVIQIGDASADDLREKVKRAIGIDLYKEG
jgi:V/A-type H+-transporting ATPase subunit F